MITCPRDVFRDALAYSVIANAGARKVHRPAVQMSGLAVDGGDHRAELLEYALPSGETVARMVKACGEVECWLRHDLATETLIARADAEAEVERIKKDMIQHLRSQNREKQPETYVLSSACVHAAARHQSRVGRLWDRNSRGDKVRGNLVAALDRAVTAEAK